MEPVQLTLDLYASWLEQEQKWRLSDEDKRLVRLGYTRKKRGQTKEREILTAENKQREYRRYRTFDTFLNERERLRKRAQNKPKMTRRYTEAITQDDDELTVAMKTRHASISRKCCTNRLPFDLTVDYLVELARSSNYCPIFGERLIYFGDGQNAQVDRSIPELGYVKGNIVFLSSRANRLKSDHTIETCQLLLDYLRTLG